MIHFPNTCKKHYLCSRPIYTARGNTIKDTSDKESYIQTLKPTIWVGKNGCTEDLIAETKRQLEVRKIIKVKWLQSCDLNEAEILELAEKTSSEVLDSRGRMVVLGAKNRGKSVPPASSKSNKSKNQSKKQSARDKVKSFYLDKK